MQNIIPYHPSLKDKAKYLRNHSTKAEIQLWQYLKNKQLCGRKFIRQKPLLHYIVDFYCPEYKLIIELDGYSHDNASAQQADDKRSDELKIYGVDILRFTNDEVYYNIESVLTVIKEYILKYRD